MARIPYRDVATAPEQVRDLVAKLPPLNIFRMLAHVDTFIRGFGGLGGAILGEAKLDARLRELVILRVGARSPAPYEVQQHVPIRACRRRDRRGDRRGDAGAADRVLLRAARARDPDADRRAPRGAARQRRRARRHARAVLRPRGVRGGADDRLLYDGRALSRDDGRRSRDRVVRRRHRDGERPAAPVDLTRAARVFAGARCPLRRAAGWTAAGGRETAGESRT